MKAMRMTDNNRETPPLPPMVEGAPGINKFKHRPRFGLILESPSEAEQMALFETLKGQGFMPRVVTV
jgi:hypothetical protein